MLVSPKTWLPASRCEDVLGALPPDVGEARAPRRTGRRSSWPPLQPHGRRGGSAARRPARLARRHARRARAAAPRARARTRRRAGRTSRSRPARATSSCTRRCASWRGASRPSGCTSTSPFRTRRSALRALNAIRGHLPVLLALSANSPFWQGRDSGLASARTPIFQAFPRTGPPRAVLGLRRLRRGDRRARALRRHPGADLPVVGRATPAALRDARGADHGPQIRVADTAAIAALVQCLVRLESEGEPVHGSARGAEREPLLAARDGMDARLVEPAAWSPAAGARPPGRAGRRVCAGCARARVRGELATWRGWPPSRRGASAGRRHRRERRGAGESVRLDRRGGTNFGLVGRRVRGSIRHSVGLRTDKAANRAAHCHLFLHGNKPDNRAARASIPLPQCKPLTFARPATAVQSTA